MFQHYALSSYALTRALLMVAPGLGHQRLREGGPVAPRTGAGPPRAPRRSTPSLITKIIPTKIC